MWRRAARWSAVGAIAVATGCGDAGTDEVSSQPPAIDAVQQEQLETLGYVQWSDELGETDAEQAGVLRHEPARTYPGLNLFSREHGSNALLLDMDGEQVHEWAYDGANNWGVARPQPGGDIIVIARHEALMRLDWDSNVVWKSDLWAHHDVAQDDEGRIYVLRKGKDFDPVPEGVLPVIRDGLAVLDADGNQLREFDFNPLFPEAAPEPTLEATKAYMEANPQAVKGENSDEPFLDTLHSNSVMPLPRDVPGLGKKGDLLISMRRTSTVALIDPKGERVLWRWGPGEILRQHHPTLLDNDHLLIFDNGSRDRPWSRIVEYSPVEDRIVWEYRADPPESFYSNARGSAQKLPNGNVLVTDSSSGRVFEVTEAGEMVWEYLNPTLREKRGKVQRETIYRMWRISDDLLASFPLGRAQASAMPDEG